MLDCILICKFFVFGLCKVVYKTYHCDKTTDGMRVWSYQSCYMGHNVWHYYEGCFQDIITILFYTLIS